MAFGLRRQRKRVKTVLIVEDEPLVAFDAEHILTEEGYIVAGAVDNVADAIRLLESRAIDLVLADVILSGIEGGIEVARAARSRGMPVLFLSGNCPIDARTLALGCLAKPYRPRDLVAALDAVEIMLGGAMPRRQLRALTLYGPIPAEEPDERD